MAPAGIITTTNVCVILQWFEYLSLEMNYIYLYPKTLKAYLELGIVNKTYMEVPTMRIYLYYGNID